MGSLVWFASLLNPMDRPLSMYASREQVENVVLFIADSVRFDSLPGTIADRGVVARAIAPSTFTASSIPSIVTSQHVPEHKVWDFTDRLSDRPYLLESPEHSGVNVEHVWGPDYEHDEKPTLKLLNIDQNTRLRELSEPFLYIVHDHGGHAPYGAAEERFEESTREFYESHVGDEAKVIKLYHGGIEKSTERFIELYHEIADKGILEDTLIIYTSDHGEILGEYGGIFGHNSPMVPEVLAVPMVFMGAGLEEGRRIGTTFSSIDIPPTLLGAQGRTIPRSMVGIDQWNETQRSHRPVRSDVWKTTRYKMGIQYAASSVWDKNGGVVVHRGPTLGRVIFSLGMNLYLAPYTPILRQDPISRLRKSISPYIKKRIRYGEYNGDSDPEKLLNEDFVPGQAADAIEVDEDQLEALGYMT